MILQLLWRIKCYPMCDHANPYMSDMSIQIRITKFAIPGFEHFWNVLSVAMTGAGWQLFFQNKLFLKLVCKQQVQWNNKWVHFPLLRWAQWTAHEKPQMNWKLTTHQRNTNKSKLIRLANKHLLNIFWIFKSLGLTHLWTYFGINITFLYIMDVCWRYRTHEK